jgi:ribosomal protein S18 acetylase RimI-like enzyme
VINSTLRSRQALLGKTANHPYVALTSGEALAAYERDGALVWVSEGPWGPLVASLGDPSVIVPLLAELHGVDALGGSRWLHLPRTASETMTAHLAAAAHDDWDFLWITEPPAPVDGEERMVALTEADTTAIEQVLDDALPHGTSRPGDPRVRAWYGIRDGERLVAVAGDRSRGDAGSRGVAFLAGIAVATDQQGRGLGAALTAALTRRLLTEYATVSLGVMADTVAAARLYERLGFRERLALSSINLA